MSVSTDSWAPVQPERDPLSGSALGPLPGLEPLSELEQAQRRLEVTRRELQETRDQLTRASRLAGLEQLTVGLADELVQPLTAVLGLAERLRELLEREFPERVPEADLILQSSRRMAQIVESVRRLGSATGGGNGVEITHSRAADGAAVVTLRLAIAGPSFASEPREVP